MICIVAPAVGWKAERTNSPELKLWRAAFACYVADAMRFHQGLPARYGQESEAERAFRDILATGPHLRHLCDMVDMDAAVCTQKFKRWTQRHPAGQVLDKRTRKNRAA